MNWRTVEVETTGEVVEIPAEVLEQEPPKEVEPKETKKRGRPGKQLSSNPSHDPVNHPSHYTAGGIETIDFIEAKQLNYHLGNVVKYVSRAGKKTDHIQDLEKAAWYLNREITRLKGQA